MNKIGWCDKTINPVVGCPNGCEYCYAKRINDRFKIVEEFSQPQFFPERLKGLRTKKPQIIFIDSMSDIGHWKWGWFRETIRAIYDNPQNTYLALTKNIDKFNADLRSKFALPAQLLIGVTITNNEQARAAIYFGGADFISFEPLLEQIEPYLLEKLTCRWWIVGDITKNGVPQGVTQKQWVQEMRDMCGEYDRPIFMKDSIKELMGDEFVQEFPKGMKGEGK